MQLKKEKIMKKRKRTYRTGYAVQKKSICLRVTDEIRSFLEAEAEKRGVKITVVVREILEKAVS